MKNSIPTCLTGNLVKTHGILSAAATPLGRRFAVRALVDPAVTAIDVAGPFGWLQPGTDAFLVHALGRSVLCDVVPGSLLEDRTAEAWLSQRRAAAVTLSCRHLVFDETDIDGGILGSTALALLGAAMAPIGSGDVAAVRREIHSGQMPVPVGTLRRATGIDERRLWAVVGQLVLKGEADVDLSRMLDDLNHVVGLADEERRMSHARRSPSSLFREPPPFPSAAPNGPSPYHAHKIQVHRPRAQPLWDVPSERLGTRGPKAPEPSHHDLDVARRRLEYVLAVEAGGGIDVRPAEGERPPALRTVKVWRRRLRRGGGNVVALVPLRARKGNRMPRLAHAVERILEEEVRLSLADRCRPTARETHRRIVTRVLDADKGTGSALNPPSYATVRRRITQGSARNAALGFLPPRSNPIHRNREEHP